MKKWLNSASHAITGIGLLIRTERNFRIELVMAAGAIAMGFWLNISLVSFCIILLCIGAVLSAEAFNSAVERMADIYSSGPHPEIKNLKDISAGAVLILAIASLLIGLLIFGPEIIEKASRI